MEPLLEQIKNQIVLAAYVPPTWVLQMPEFDLFVKVNQFLADLKNAPQDVATALDKRPEALKEYIKKVVTAMQNGAEQSTSISELETALKNLNTKTFLTKVNLDWVKGTVENRIKTLQNIEKDKLKPATGLLSNPKESEPESEGLSWEAQLGIALASLVVIIAIVVFIVYLVQRQQKGSTQSPPSEELLGASE